MAALTPGSGATPRRRGKLTPIAIDGRDHVSTAQAATYLGVRVQTLYAYVSRGILTRTTIAGQRGSFFALADVEELATRGRTPRAPGASDRIHTQVTLIGADDTLSYRGRDVSALVRAGARYEDVCALLWHASEASSALAAAAASEGTAAGVVRSAAGDVSGGAAGDGDARVFGLLGRPGDDVLARSAVAALPPGARGIDLLKVCVDLLGASDPLRGDLRPEQVRRVGGRILAGCVAALTLRAGQADSLAAPTSGSGELLAHRLGAALDSAADRQTADHLGDARVRLLDAAMCLLADHDLAMSTRAARVAASVRAHPYAVVGAALGGMDSPLHGVAPRAAYRLLADIIDDPAATVGQLVASGQVPIGFGHRIYRHRDPRADLLLDLLRETDHAAVSAADQLIDAMRRRHDTFPTSDVALATLAHVMGWRAEAGEVVFALARMAGWIAHALEEYEAQPLRYRIAGVYAGVRPPGD